MFWRRVLIYTHRWLGIAGGCLFVSWFVSGIVLIYVGMPILTDEERLSRLPDIDLSEVGIDVTEAVVKIGMTPRRIFIGMLGDRPVYRFAGSDGRAAVYADTGEVLDTLDTEEVLAMVSRFVPEHARTLHYDTRLTNPDQWTFQSGEYFPLHRVRLGDGSDTVIYVSDRTGEPVMQTTRNTRRWGYMGAVLHWLYFRPLRSHVEFWAELVIWLSALGCLLSLSGLIWGMWRIAPSRAYRLRDEMSYSPYAGLMRWHHYAGLLFGFVTFTWIFSGGLSMDPWNWHPGTSPTRVQQEIVAGGSIRFGTLTVEKLRTGFQIISKSFITKELEVFQFLDEPHMLATNVRDTVVDDALVSLPNTMAGEWLYPLDQRLVSIERPEYGAFSRFDADVFDELAVAAMPGADIIEATWLRTYDNYYYDRSRRRRLPVFRVMYDDPQRTWLYFDPYRGVITRKEERLTRLNRWLYRGLHSLDFPIFYYRRPLWDLVVILLGLGGIVVSATSLSQGWHRLRSHLRRFLRSAARRAGRLHPS